MQDSLYNSCIYIDLHTISENIRSLYASVGPGCAVIPVLKGDAMGLGMVKVARCISSAVSVPCFAVAHLSEGIQLRSAGFSEPILILGGALPCQCAAAVEYDLTPGAGRPGLIAALAREAAARGKTASVHLTVDTGLGRLGVRPGEELDTLIREAKENEGLVRITGTYSHFADAEKIGSRRALEQLRRYHDALEQLQRCGIDPGLRHMSASAASEWLPEANFDAIRVGRRLFFDSPTAPNGSVKEVASWRTFVTKVRNVSAGERFGYGDGAALDHDGVLAIIGAGYGDGLMRELVRSRAPVLINGARAPLVGVCMDQAYVDVNGIPCRYGDEVTLFGWSSDGRSFLSAQEVAAYMNDEGCGLTAALLPRVKRVYIE